jgi:hypothetical protein
MTSTCNPTGHLAASRRASQRPQKKAFDTGWDWEILRKVRPGDKVTNVVPQVFAPAKEKEWRFCMHAGSNKRGTASLFALMDENTC